MLRFTLLLGCVGLVAISTGCSQDTSAADVQAVRARNDAWSKDVGTKDLAKFAMYYADDASFLVPGAPAVHGIANIKAAIEPMLKDPNFSLSFQVEKVEAAGNLAYTQGPYALTLSGKDGKPFTDKGKYLTVWKKQADGNWLAVEDMINSDAAQQ